MAQVTLERILHDIKTLEPEELMQVQQAVQARLAPAGYAPAGTGTPGNARSRPADGDQTAAY